MADTDLIFPVVNDAPSGYQTRARHFTWCGEGVNETLFFRVDDMTNAEVALLEKAINEYVHREYRDWGETKVMPSLEDDSDRARFVCFERRWASMRGDFGKWQPGGREDDRITDELHDCASSFSDVIRAMREQKVVLAYVWCNQGHGPVPVALMDCLTAAEARRLESTMQELLEQSRDTFGVFHNGEANQDPQLWLSLGFDWNRMMPRIAANEVDDQIEEYGEWAWEIAQELVAMRQLPGLRSDELQPNAQDVQPSRTEAAIIATPSWDADRFTLTVGAKGVKFRGSAANVVPILSTFQECGWQTHIDDPLTNGPNAERLRQTLRQINSRTRDLRIRFEADGTGEGITWRHKTDAESSVAEVT